MRIDELPEDKGGSFKDLLKDSPPIQLLPIEPRSLHGCYNPKYDPLPVLRFLENDKNNE